MNSPQHLKEFLERKYHQYNQSFFIETDPIQIPHRYTRKEDREIAGFIAATLAWGQRPAILKSSLKWLHLMEDAPFDFTINFKPKDLKRFKGFVHRTFNETDCCYFMQALQHIYHQHQGLENAFSRALNPQDVNVKKGILHFRELFFSLPHPARTTKHISNPEQNAAGKRINMFLRWMVRKDNYGVDLGIWPGIKPAQLICPLDVHVSNTARSLGILNRKANDWKAAEELTAVLASLDPLDPVKFDFALFGLGVFEGFGKIKP